MDLLHSFHGVLKLEEVEILLQHHGVGEFMFWKMYKPQDTYIITVKGKRSYVHYLLAASTNGNISNKVLADCVQYYRNNPLDLGPMTLRLTNAVSRFKDPVGVRTEECKLRNSQTFANSDVWGLMGGFKSKPKVSETTHTDKTATRQQIHGCKTIKNEGFEDGEVRENDTELQLDDNDEAVTYFNNNNNMKWSPNKKDDPKCQQMLTKTFRKSMSNLSFVRGILESFKIQSSGSSRTSMESEIDGYCAFPIDDDIFDILQTESTTGSATSSEVFMFEQNEQPYITTKRNSALNSTSLENISEEKISKLKPSCDKIRAEENDGIEKEQHQTPLPIHIYDTNKHSMPMPQRPVSCISCIGLNNNENQNGNNVLRRNNRENQHTKRKSYYVPGEDISPDAETFEESVKKCASVLDVTKMRKNGNIVSSSNEMQVCEAWGDIGDEGGVIELQGSGVSFHFLPQLKKALPKMGQKSKSTTDLKSSNYKTDAEDDGRIVIALEDPPDVLNDRTRTVVGPMVRLDYGNKRIISPGAVIQIEVNTTLKSQGQSGTKVECEYSCLFSKSSEGSFADLAGSYYQYGNTLQITISSDLVEKLISKTDTGGSICLVPIAKLSEKHRQNPFASVWDGIDTKTTRVGVYGPKRPHRLATCCVSISSSSICPPTLWTKQNNKEILLHLWASYRIVFQSPQSFQITLQSDPSSQAHVTFLPDAGDCIVSADDFRRKSRINKTFLLKYPKDESVAVKENQETKQDQKQKDKFSLFFTGIKNEFVNEMQFAAPKRPPSCSTPVRRWKRSISSIPPKSFQDNKNSRKEDYLYLWHDAQREAKTKLRPAFVIPGAERRVEITRLAVAITSRTRGGKSQTGSGNLLAQYGQSDIMPILGKQTLWAHGTARYKEWHVGCANGKIGLIHTKCVRIFDSDRCYDRLDGRVTVEELIESIVEPVGYLSYCYATLRDKLLENVERWTLLASILRFGENYIARVVGNLNDDSKKETHNKLSLFLEKYKEYCDTGSRKRSMQKEIIRALLYMGHYELVISLLADFCVLSVSVEVGQRWKELAPELETVDVASTNDSTKNRTKNSNRSPMKRSKSDRQLRNITNNENGQLVSEERWKPAFDLLSSWGKQFGDNHRSMLIHLHEAVNNMTESPNRYWKHFTASIMLLFATDSLEKLENKT